MIWKSSKNENRNALQVEPLEPRMMLSNVVINAAGDTGQEQIELRIDDTVVAEFTLGTQLSTYSYQTEQTVTADRVRVAFTNDLYLPEQNFDRNVTIQSIEIDGTTFLTSAANVFADGVWDPSSEQIISGFGLGDSLQANGFFQFSEAASEIDFDGKTWLVVGGTGSTESLFVDQAGRLNLRGVGGPLTVSSEIDINGVDALDIDVIADRLFESGFQINGGPGATIGVDYFNLGGRRLDQRSVEIRGPVDQPLNRDPFIVPENATSAYAWLWIDGFDEGVNIPLRIERFDIQAVDLSGGDVTPPTVSLFPLTLTENGLSSVNFTIRVEDDVFIDLVPADSLVVTTPDGTQITPAIGFGPPTNTNTLKDLVFFYTNPEPLTEADNGIYTVTLQDNKIRDFAGNATPGQVLGTYEIAIPTLTDDHVAPQVTLLTPDINITSPPTGGRGSDIQFTIDYVDDRLLGELASDRIMITGPNGYQGFGRGIAGGSTNSEGDGFFEITYAPLPADGVWSQNENGEYLISLVAGTVMDANGNETPGGVLGSFQVNL